MRRREILTLAGTVSISGCLRASTGTTTEANSGDTTSTRKSTREPQASPTQTPKPDAVPEAVRLSWEIENPTDGAAHIEDTIYITSGRQIGGYSVNKVPDWLTDLPEQFYRGIETGDGAIYTGNQRGQLFKIDAENGTKEWTTQVTDGHIESVPLVAGETVIVNVDSPRGYIGMDVTDGSEKWRIENGLVTIYNRDNRPGIVVDNPTRAILRGNGNLQMVDPEDGTVIRESDPYSDTESPPAFHGGRVFLGGQNSVWAFDIESLSVSWKADLKAAASTQPTIRNGRAFFGCTDGRIYTFRASDGEPLWEYRADDPISTSPIFYRGHLYAVTSANELIVLKPGTGNEAFTTEISNSARCQPFVVDGALVVDGAVYELDMG